MDMNLGGIALAFAAIRTERSKAPLHVRDESAYYAQYGSRWPVLVWTGKVIEMIWQAGFAMPAIARAERVVRSWRLAIASKLVA